MTFLIYIHLKPIMFSPEIFRKICGLNLPLDGGGELEFLSSNAQIDISSHSGTTRSLHKIDIVQFCITLTAPE